MLSASDTFLLVLNNRTRKIEITYNVEKFISVI